MIFGNPWAKQAERESALSLERLKFLLRYEENTGVFFKAAPRCGVREGAAGHIETNGYRRIRIDGYRYLAHRLAWFYVHGVWPQNTIDHKNLNRDDNRIENLREATHSENHANGKGFLSLSGLKGAHWNRFRGYWQSTIKHQGKSYFLGRFSTAEEAHAAYCLAAKRLFGEFARAQ